MDRDDERRLFGEYLGLVLDSLEPLAASLERMAEMFEVTDEPPEDDASAGWEEFLEDHPELTRLEFTDDEVYDALAWAARPDTQVATFTGIKFRPDFPPGAHVVLMVLEARKGCWTGSVSDSPGRSALMRVVAALKRLEVAGRVRQQVRVVYGKRESSIWHPIGTGA